MFYHLKIDTGWTSYKQYYLPTVELKDYNIMIDGKNFFHQPTNNHLRTYQKIRKFTNGQGNYYANGYLLNYVCFEDYYKRIAAIDINKQQALNVDPKAIQQINFTEDLDCNENTTTFIIIEEAKETILDFWQGTMKVL